MNRTEIAQEAYCKAFRVAFAPNPYGINPDRVAEVLEQAVADGKPVPDSFDWWAHLPPGAVA